MIAPAARFRIGCRRVENVLAADLIITGVSKMVSQLSCRPGCVTLTHFECFPPNKFRIDLPQPILSPRV
jgi:hypothetical protein